MNRDLASASLVILIIGRVPVVGHSCDVPEFIHSDPGAPSFQVFACQEILRSLPIMSHLGRSFIEFIPVGHQDQLIFWVNVPA